MENPRHLFHCRRTTLLELADLCVGRECRLYRGNQSRIFHQSFTERVAGCLLLARTSAPYAMGACWRCYLGRSVSYPGLWPPALDRAFARVYLWLLWFCQKTFPIGIIIWSDFGNRLGLPASFTLS